MDARGSGAMYEKTGTHNPGETLTDQAVRKGGWRPPSSRDWKGPSAESWTTREHGDTTPTLADQVDQSAFGSLPSLPDQTTPTGGRATSANTRVLNPLFVEALMGWPIGWSACDSLEMVSCPSRPPSPSTPSTSDCAEIAE